MQPLEKSDLKNDLTQAREDLLGLFSSIDEIEWTTVVYSEGQVWTVAHILGHLTGAEASMTRLIEMIRDGGEGVPPDFDLQRWNARGIKKTSDKSPQDLIAAMSINRVRLFTLIDEMQDEDFSKSGRHGSLRIMTIQEILEQIANHERHHVQDIREALI